MTDLFTRYFAISLRLRAGIILALLLGSAVAGLCSDNLNSSGPQALDLTQMSIEDLMDLKVVTAGKKPETIMNTAAAVFVITHEEIEHYGYQVLAQALRRISGFYTEYDHGYNTVGARGYLPNADLNRRVLVLVDGHKVNDYLYGQAPVDQDLPVDMRDIERIEIVKGPGSALWGSEALLCIVNCITKTSWGDMDGLEFGQDLGWWQGQRIAYGESLPGGMEVSGSMSLIRSDGQKRLYFPEYDVPEKNNGIAEGLDGERSERGYLSIANKGFRFYFNRVARIKDIPTAYWRSVFSTPGVDVKDERAFMEMSFENPVSYAGDGKLFYRIYQDEYDAICHFNKTNVTYPDRPPIIYSRALDLARAFGVETRYSRNVSSSVNATLGIEYLRTYRTRRWGYDVDIPDELTRDRRADFTLFSYYVQTDWDINQAMRLVAGTRLDDHSIFGENGSPRMGLIYKASPESTLKLLYGKAFRVPSISEIRTNDNPLNLHPEKINTTEFVWERQMGNNGRLVTSLYEFELYDIILNRLVDNVTRATNAGSVTSRGIDTQYDFRLKNGGSGYFNLAAMSAKSGDSISPSPLLASPRLVAGCGLAIPVFKDKAYLASDMQFLSKRRTPEGQKVYGAVTTNLTLTSRTLFKNHDVSFGVANLFNTKSYAPTQPKNRDENSVYLDRIPQLERTLHLQITRRL